MQIVLEMEAQVLFLLFMFYSNCSLSHGQTIFKEGEELKLFDFLTNTSRYDLRDRPRLENHSIPLEVHTSMFIYFIGNIEAQKLEFETHLLFRHRWRDDRLKYTNMSREIKLIEGEDWFQKYIWTPNIFIENESESTLMKTTRDSTFVRIHDTGTVHYHYRLKTVVLCDMKLKRFPHDTQNCTIRMESWSAPNSELVLKWESPIPIGQNDFSQPEYTVLKIQTRETITVYKEPGIEDPEKCDLGNLPWLVGRKINGNYSTLMVDFILKRETGQYVIEYYVPSMLLVMMSWVSFWLDPNAVPGRTTLGTSTWLTLITLTRSTGSDQLPKVSYVKFIDIWFLVCTCFIFFSLLEFALVNIVWRRKDIAHMKKLTSGRILAEGMRQVGRAAFTTPSVSSSRKNSTADSDSKRSVSPFSRRMSREDRCGSKASLASCADFGSSNHLTVTSLETYINSHSDDSGDDNCDTLTINVPVKNAFERGPHHGKGKLMWENVLQRLHINREQKVDDDNSSHSSTQKKCSSKGENLNSETKSVFLTDQFEEMTYEEIAVWVDTRARVIFPLSFLVFNLFYWILVADDDAFNFLIGDDQHHDM